MMRKGMKKKSFRKNIASLPVVMEVTEIGADIAVLCHGGSKPHIGATAIAVPFRTNTGDVSASVSVIALPGHKEGNVCIQIAELLSKELSKTVLVSCGIHYDAISKKLIDTIITELLTLCDNIIKEFSL
jgi:hypothetical protein